MVRPQAGYSLAELLLAIGILAISVLSVLALSLRIAAASQKSNDLMVGEMMVDRLLDRVVAEVRNDKPPGKKAKFWGTADHLPWSTGKITAEIVIVGSIEHETPIVDEIAADPAFRSPRAKPEISIAFGDNMIGSEQRHCIVLSHFL